jgi:hypothetical protein
MQSAMSTAFQRRENLVLSAGGMTNNVRVSDPACGWEVDGKIIPKIVKNANITSMLKLRADI